MIRCSNIVKEFGNPPQRVLHDLTFTIDDGDFVSISGMSGSGKSTLLYIISTLDVPTAGSVVIDDHNIAELSSDKLHAFRNIHIGFIFQFHYLLPELTALENVLLPARNLGKMKELSQEAMELLDRLGIAEHRNKIPGRMSGGQQQRVAIARALLMRPKYLFADEPTGNLDSENGRIVMDILRQINAERKATIVLVTHEPSYAAMAKREIYLVDGRMQERN